MNMIEGGRVMGSINEQFAFPSQVTLHEWLGKAMMNMN